MPHMDIEVPQVDIQMSRGVIQTLQAIIQMPQLAESAALIPFSLDRLLCCNHFFCATLSN